MATVKTVVDNDVLRVDGEIPNHNHFAVPEKSHMETVRNKVRAQACSRAQSSAVQVVASTLGDSAGLPAPSNAALKRTVWNVRFEDQKKRLKAGEGAAPANFDSLLDLELPPSLRECDGDNFLVYDSGAGEGVNRILIFACQQNFDVLTQCAIWLADGTFKAAPSMFKQVHTIYGHRDGFTLPCVFACLPNKKPSS